jgi:hypothetical protein
MLGDERRTAAPGLEPCEIIVFMAYTIGATEETGAGSWQRLRDAGRMINSAGVTLVAGCPYSLLKTISDGIRLAQSFHPLW